MWRPGEDSTRVKVFVLYVAGIVQPLESYVFYTPLEATNKHSARNSPYSSQLRND